MRLVFRVGSLRSAAELDVHDAPTGQGREALGEIVKSTITLHLVQIGGNDIRNFEFDRDDRVAHCVSFRRYGCSCLFGLLADGCVSCSARRYGVKATPVPLRSLSD